MEKKVIIITTLVALVVVGAMIILTHYEEEGSQATEYSESDLASLATCLADTGVKMYGAFWCTHCQAQKRAFGEAQSLMPYVECSTPDGKNQVQVCADAGITSYPTWEFADGGIIMGEVPLQQLAQRAQCEFPGVVLEDITADNEVNATIDGITINGEDTPLDNGAVVISDVTKKEDTGDSLQDEVELEPVE